MSPRGSIAARNVWKRFHADPSHAQLRYKLQQMAKGNLRQRKGWRWALQDVNLAAEPGESLALVGANGSGKSTLLKILTRVMYPYAGRVEVEGRVGALIEVAAGIHPELSGRENVYLYGTLLGLSRAAVAERFDAIVDFAELEDAVDRQVKFYSSGMKMRLGFGVAAFLEPDVLLVDEVLAVGDANFQQKCLNRMRTVLNEGTTLVLVSHDLAALEATCSKGVWLRDGIVAAEGPIGEVLGAYRHSVEEAAEERIGRPGATRLTGVDVAGLEGGAIESDGPMRIKAVVERGSDDGEARRADLFFGITEGTAAPIFTVRTDLLFETDEIELDCIVPHVPLPRGRYYVWSGVFQGPGKPDLVPWHPIAHFDVHGPKLAPAPKGIVRLSPTYVPSEWRLADSGPADPDPADVSRRKPRASKR